jgi:hypothetical protein
MSRVFRLLVLAAAFTPHSAHAWQRTPPTSTARLGELVRVRTTDRAEHRGTLAFASSDSLVLNAAAASRIAIPAPSVAQVDAFRRRPLWSRMFRGALIGAAIGVAIPLVAEGGSHWGRVVEVAPITGYLFGVIGSGIGVISRSRHWERVALPAP